MSGAKSKPSELRRIRRAQQHSCWGRLIIAPLWVAYGANLGTLLRTCDALGACMAVPKTSHYHEALQKGDTLGQKRPHIHWVQPSKAVWLDAQRKAGYRLVAVELAEDATRLPWLSPAREPTVLLLGHEHQGIPDDVLACVDECVEIPMVGVGASLNVAVAGSLVAYRLAGLA
jgi:tRNA (guanosine-2'-O-)-methyltransferase